MSNDRAVDITHTASMSTHTLTTLSSALQTSQLTVQQPTVDSAAAIDMKAVVQAAQTMSIKEQEEEEDQENAGVGAANAQLNLVSTHTAQRAAHRALPPGLRSGGAAAVTTTPTHSD